MRNVRIALLATLLLLSLAVMSSYALSPLDVCGNVNQSPDGLVTLGDITLIIDHVYISKAPLPNPQVGNINGSLDGLITLSDVTMLIDAVYISKNQPTCTYTEVTQSSCLGGTEIPMAMAEPGPDSVESVVMEVVNGDLHIYHINAWYQCCPVYDIEVEIVGDHIYVQELDLAGPDGCKCMCYFNFESVISLLPEGWYQVTLIHDDGDTVSTQTIVIQNSTPAVLGYSSSKSPRNAPLVICRSTTHLCQWVDYDYADNVLTMNHYHTFFDCPFELALEFQRAGNTLRFYEINEAPVPVDCIERFVITASVWPILPGEYVIEVYQQETIDDEPWLVSYRHVLLE